MDSFVTSWAFGFGGWIGVLGSTILFVNSPQYSTFLTFLVSPWFGGIGMYILMYLTHCWVNTAIQIANAMMRHEIIMTVLTALFFVTLIAVTRVLVDMDREHRTQAEIAEEETTPTTTAADAAEATEATDATEEESGDESGESGEDEEDAEGDDADDEDSGETETEDETAGESSDSSLNKARTDESSYENIKTPQQPTLKTSSVSPVPKIPDI
jgi:hypothetical protein